MQSYTSDRLRNVVLMGHGGAGKTTLGEAMLLASGAITRLGSVDDGTSICDFDDEEKQHQYSIEASVVHFDPPADAKDYLHRSGRTARAGATGNVVSLVTGEQKRAVGRMQRDLALRAPIEAPQIDALDHGGHRQGRPADTRPRPIAATSRTAKPAPAPRPQNRRPKDAKSVYVANLPWKTTTDEVRGLFDQFGDVHETTIIIDRKTGQSRGFGFVDMPERDARTAIAALHGTALEGRDLTVRFAKPQRSRR